MMRLGWLIGAVALGVGLSAGPVLAQDAAPRKLVAPVRGEAQVELTAPDTKPVGNNVVTTIRVEEHLARADRRVPGDRELVRSRAAVGPR